MGREDRSAESFDLETPGIQKLRVPIKSHEPKKLVADMDWHTVPETIRKQYESDRKIHAEYCDDGWTLEINKFTGEEKENPCPFCKRFRKELFDGDY